MSNRDTRGQSWENRVKCCISEEIINFLEERSRIPRTLPWKASSNGIEIVY